MNPLDQLDIDENEIQTALNNIQKNTRVRDGRICACGHSMNRHTMPNGAYTHTCQIAKSYCPCQTPRAVLEASDTRPFMRKTTGAAANHALTLGMKAAINADIQVKWIIELKCDRCQTPGPVIPVALNSRNIKQDEPGLLNPLVCRTCLGELR